MTMPVREKPKVIYSELYESYVVIYSQPVTYRNTIEKGLTLAEAQAFAKQKEEEMENPILWYAK